MKQSFGFAGLVVALALVACSGIQGFSPKRVRGTISYYDEPVRITVPDSVRRGETFTVTVMTFVGGCLEPGTTELEVVGLEAEVTPYDLDATRPDYPCTADISFHPHTAEVVLTKLDRPRFGL